MNRIEQNIEPVKKAKTKKSVMKRLKLENPNLNQNLKRRELKLKKLSLMEKHITRMKMEHFMIQIQVKK